MPPRYIIEDASLCSGILSSLLYIVHACLKGALGHSPVIVEWMESAKVRFDRSGTSSKAMMGVKSPCFLRQGPQGTDTYGGSSISPQLLCKNATPAYTPG